MARSSHHSWREGRIENSKTVVAADVRRIPRRLSGQCGLEVGGRLGRRWITPLVKTRCAPRLSISRRKRDGTGCATRSSTRSLRPSNCPGSWPSTPPSNVSMATSRAPSLAATRTSGQAQSRLSQLLRGEPADQSWGGGSARQGTRCGPRSERIVEYAFSPAALGVLRLRERAAPAGV